MDKWKIELAICMWQVVLTRELFVPDTFDFAGLHLGAEDKKSKQVEKNLINDVLK